MSFAVLIMRFSKGEPFSMERELLAEILLPFGEIVSTDYGLEITTEKNLFEYASVIGEGETEFSGIFFNRPDLNNDLIQLIFDILSIENTYFFDQEMEFLFSRNLESSDLPKDMINNESCDASNIESVYELKSKLVEKGYIN